MQNYYSILNLPQTCDQISITKSFHTLKNQIEFAAHQDEESSNVYIELYAAYEVLKDPFFRRRYDSCLGNYPNNIDKELQKEISQLSEVGRDIARNNLDTTGIASQEELLLGTGWVTSNVIIRILFLPIQMLLYSLGN